MAIYLIPTLLVNIDQFCDYIPVISTLTNLVDLVAKCILKLVKNPQLFFGNHYFRHLDNKSFSRCFTLLFFGIANLMIGIIDFVALHKKITTFSNAMDVIEENPKEGIKKIFQAAKLGHVTSMHYMGNYYMRNGGKADIIEAMKWHRKAADAGYSRSLFPLGSAFFSQRTFNPLEGYKVFHELTYKHRHPKGIYHLALCYLKGDGVAINVPEALRLLNLACHKNFAEAFTTLGDLYKKGEVVEMDLKRSFEFFLKSAKLNSPFGMSRVGFALIEGKGIEMDEEEGIGWLERAAESGDEEAQYYLYQLNKNRADLPPIQA